MTNQPQPETVLGTETRYVGEFLLIREDDVKLPNGSQIRREVVEYPDSVVVVPIDSDDNVIMVRQYRYPIGTVLLEAPAGKLDALEVPSEAAQRELQEETGLAYGELCSLGRFWVSPGYCTQLMHAFFATDLRPSRLEPDDDEDIRTERVPLARVTQLIRNGEIQDAKTIAALLMALHVFGLAPNP